MADQHLMKNELLHLQNLQRHFEAPSSQASYEQKVHNYCNACPSHLILQVLYCLSSFLPLINMSKLRLLDMEIHDKLRYLWYLSRIMLIFGYAKVSHSNLS